MLRENKRTIVYTGNFSVNTMNAAGKRVFANALIMKELGFHMVLVGTEQEDKTTEDILDTKCEIEGIEVFHYPGKLFQHSRSNFFAFYKQFEKLIKQRQWNIKAIIGYNSPSTAPFIGKVIKYCHRNGIKYITDVADWLIVDSDNPLFRVMRQFDITLKNAYYTNKSDGIIAISRWLACYYKKRINNTIIIPPLALDSISDSNYVPNDTPKIVYAGLPFRKGSVLKNYSDMKDRFDIVCTVLSKLKSKGLKFEFHVFGFTKEEFLYSISTMKNTIENLGSSIIFHGMAPMEKVQQAIQTADYTMLIREKNRMTMAGFPTKVSESVTCGTPVITTRTSDIELYLPEGKGAFFVDIKQYSDLLNKVEELLEKDAAERIIQKNNCIANKSFYKSTYRLRVKKFLEKIIADD